MKANLSALGDGIIVTGVGIFVLSLAIVYYQASSSSGSIVVAGFFAFAASILIAGVLKVKHAFSSLRDEKQSNLRTPVTATIIVLLMFFYFSFVFLYRVRF